MRSRFTFFVDIIPDLLLIIFLLLGLYCSNSQFHFFYEKLISTNIMLKNISLPSLLSVVNDGLMSLFFLLLGLEIKREFISGALQGKKKLLFPAIGAIGGVLVPAIIFIVLNKGDLYAMRGWAIPTATDVAFALGIISLLRNKVSPQIKILLTAIAIFDDLIAILIIALFYNAKINLLFLFLSMLIIGILIILNKNSVRRIECYFFFGILLWLALSRSGIHPTISGVILAFSLPSITQNDIKILNKRLESIVAYIILPLFAFINCGVYVRYLSLQVLLHRVPLGIGLGLFFGKQLGIFSFLYGSYKLNIAEPPHMTNWQHIYGMSIVGGIGFTMSLFIGALAYTGNSHFLTIYKLGVLVGSLCAVLFSMLYFLLLLEVVKIGRMKRH